MRRWKPSLEGSLAIFNVLSLLAFLILARSIDGAVWLRPFETAIVVWMWFLSLPISGFCFLLLGRGSGTGIDIVLLCGAAGINAIVWGRGLAWLLRRTLLARFAQALHEEDHPEPDPGEERPSD